MDWLLRNIYINWIANFQLHKLTPIYVRMKCMKCQIQFPFLENLKWHTHINISHLTQHNTSPIEWEFFVNHSSVWCATQFCVHIFTCFHVLFLIRVIFSIHTIKLKPKIRDIYVRYKILIREYKRFGKMCHLKTLFFDINLKLNHRRLNIHITYFIIYDFFLVRRRGRGGSIFHVLSHENVWQYILCHIILN